MADSNRNPDDFEHDAWTEASGDNDQTPAAQIAADDLVRQLQGELDEAVEARKRALADFKNYQRRATENEQRAGSMATARAVRALLPVLDHFDLALNQKPEQMTVDNLLQALRIVRDEFNRALAAQGVERIEPKPGEAFDPHIHEAVMRQPAADAQPNTIVSTMQAGYAFGEMVLRPAKVAVSAGE
jgi:molecular chaperone GrpE